MPPSTGAKMEIISTHLPKAWIDKIDELCKEGFFANRSDFIRTALYIYIYIRLYESIVPVKKSAEKLVLVSFHLPKKLLEEIDLISSRTGYRRSDIIRGAVLSMFLLKRENIGIKIDNNDKIELIAGRPLGPMAHVPLTHEDNSYNELECRIPEGAIELNDEIVNLLMAKPHCVKTVILRCNNVFKTYAIVDKVCYER